MDTIKVYGIPTCGTCKKALQWLNARAISYEFIDTKVQPPTTAQIENWVEKLGDRPLRNTSGQSYRSLPSTKDTWQAAEWIAAFSDDAMLLKRPIFVKNAVAFAVGFRDSAAIERWLADNKL